MSVYNKIIASVASASRMTHLIVLTRTAHPSVLAAGRHCELEVIALQHGVKEHSFKHGEELLSKMLTMKAMDKARSLVKSVGEKRVRSSDLSFITVSAGEGQVVCMKDIEPGKSWTCGFNKNPTDLETRMVTLLHQEFGQRLPDSPRLASTPFFHPFPPFPRPSSLTPFLLA
jgi:hypothetical protein